MHITSSVFLWLDVYSFSCFLPTFSSNAGVNVFGSMFWAVHLLTLQFGQLLLVSLINRRYIICTYYVTTRFLRKCSVDAIIVCFFSLEPLDLLSGDVSSTETNLVYRLVPYWFMKHTGNNHKKLDLISSMILKQEHKHSIKELYVEEILSSTFLLKIETGYKINLNHKRVCVCVQISNKDIFKIFIVVEMHLSLYKT